MPIPFDLTAMSDAELDRLIDEAGQERATRNPQDDARTASGGIKGQNVHDPDHGVITTPTPHHVRDQGPKGLEVGARVEGTTIKP